MGFWSDLFDALFQAGDSRKETDGSMRSSDNSHRLFKNGKGDWYGVNKGEIRPLPDGD